MEQIKDFSQYKQAISCDGIAVLEGYATWCTHCKSMEPVVDEMNQRYPDVRFYAYNTDEADEVVNELGIHQMPAFHIFKDGNMVDTITGERSAGLEKAIQDCRGEGTGSEVSS